MIQYLPQRNYIIQEITFCDQVKDKVASLPVKVEPKVTASTITTPTTPLLHANIKKTNSVFSYYNPVWFLQISMDQYS